MKFCDKQRVLSLLLVAAILSVLEQFEKIQEILFDKIGLDIQLEHVRFAYGVNCQVVAFS